MDFKVIFRDTFFADLESLLKSVAAENPSAALRLGNKIVGRGENLSFFPERYPKLRQRPEIRRYIVQRYFKVFYRIDHEARVVEILRCWDGRRESDPALAAIA
jgi:toxin ParE1/3/4